jgi:CRISPR/Cas system-associated exonuclease Cas4 (RecB family)
MTPETVNHSERAHAEFGPSSLKYVATCAGYHGKDGTSAAAEKGTRIHEALEVRDPSALHDEEEVAIYEDIIKDEDEILNGVFGDLPKITEREIRLYLELDAATPTFGTCDLLVYCPEGVAVMIDYKTGISQIDEPEKNWQAKAYALAAFQMLPHIHTIKFAFIVPLNGGTLSGVFVRDEMSALRKEISDVISKAETVRPKWATGGIDIDDVTPSVNCRFCRHEENCPALGAVCVTIAKEIRPDLLPTGPISPSEVEDPEVLERLFIVAKIVEDWAKSIKHKATGLAIGGHEFEHHKLRSMGCLKKTLEKNYLAQLGIKYGLEMTDIIEAADLTLNQVSTALHNKTDKGKKSFIVDQFESEAIDLGIVEIGPTRYSLTSK